MKIFLAGGDFFINKFNFFDFYRMGSYEYLKSNNREIMNINFFKDYILDSGIFSYLNGTKTEKTDWDKYVFDYSNFIKKYHIKKYIEIDIDKQIRLPEVEKLRNKLEKNVGWQSIPVWHTSRGYDKWLQICRDYNYICFGSFITDGLKKNKYYIIKKFLQDANENNCKVHGLGFVNFEWINKLKFYSIDSSTWVCGNKFGYLQKFDKTKIIRIKKPIGNKVKNHYKLAKFNFNEWVKVTKYYDNL